MIKTYLCCLLHLVDLGKYEREGNLKHWMLANGQCHWQQGWTSRGSFMIAAVIQFNSLLCERLWYKQVALILDITSCICVGVFCFVFFPF